MTEGADRPDAVESWLEALDAPLWPVPSWLSNVEPPRTRTGRRLSEAARLRLLGALEQGGDSLSRCDASMDPASLREHAWAIVAAWAANGSDPRHRWVFSGLRVVSDDELEEQLLPEGAPAAAARAVIEQQRARLERALSTGRDWSVADWRHHLVDHALSRHLVRGLVWTTEDGRAFLVEDEGGLADVHHDAVVLSPRARVRLVHPVELDAAELGAWGERLSDLELVQPFAQLARPVAPSAVGEGDTLSAPWSEPVPEASLSAALLARGWVRGEPDERVRVRYFHKPFAAAAVFAVLVIAPGIGREPADQRAREAFFLSSPPGGVTVESASRLPLVDVPHVPFSEVLYDLGALTE